MPAILRVSVHMCGHGSVIQIHAAAAWNSSVKKIQSEISK